MSPTLEFHHEGVVKHSVLLYGWKVEEITEYLQQKLK